MVDLQKEIHIGIIKAQQDYIKWANLGIGYSAEYLIVANIAQTISKLQDTKDINNIFVEQSIGELVEEDDLKDSSLRKGRCDICVEDDKEYSIIEVKNTLTSATKNSTKFKSIKDDIKRIELFLLNNNYFKECYVCFINANYMKDKKDTQENRELIKNKIIDRLQEFQNEIALEFKDLNFTISNNFFIEKTIENEIWAWQSVVVKITLK
ncbi:MAG: hypothetical protein JXQ76_03095 [Campylobacterales bacterium]|nr:hypothetical protein [Campylobacterales bacterium]